MAEELSQATVAAREDGEVVAPPGRRPSTGAPGPITLQNFADETAARPALSTPDSFAGAFGMPSPTASGQGHGLNLERLTPLTTPSNARGRAETNFSSSHRAVPGQLASLDTPYVAENARNRHPEALKSPGLNFRAGSETLTHPTAVSRTRHARKRPPTTVP